ncbi:hypothetical protein HELRODRAFT_171774 [Helobdella robusta]|uniref:Uncharacterized protein n=1 Tax=Helobdella robusta TaxID=6412 RepID=T1F4N2_HELRO|nr:hypothetical protein HELRODRAFT_171774 [Helobdella robusta]ESO05383.1 hypothetical protein HELRODRAFT_171774 [Helobdella robusta]
MHQRSCKTYKSLKANISKVETDNDSDGRQAAFKHTHKNTKMPKSSIHRSKANAFFQMELKPLDIISVSRDNILFAANCDYTSTSVENFTPYYSNGKKKLQKMNSLKV